MRLPGKILLIPSVLLTKGLIASHIKATAKEITDALDYLLHQQLLTVDKYLRCGKRQIKGYLKYVPDDIGSRVNRYLLQRRLLDVEVKVSAYINSLHAMSLITPSLRPSDLLLMRLQDTAYSQLGIDITTTRESMCTYDHVYRSSQSNAVCSHFLDPRKKRKSEEREISSDPERLVLEDRRRKIKPEKGK